MAQGVALRGRHMPEQLTSMQRTRGEPRVTSGPSGRAFRGASPLHLAAQRLAGMQQTPRKQCRADSTTGGECGRCHRVRPVLSSESFLKASEFKIKKGNLLILSPTAYFNLF